MKIFIPEIGTDLVLKTDWIFPLFIKDYRNLDLWADLTGLDRKDVRWEWSDLLDGTIDVFYKSTKISYTVHYITIPKGTKLRVDRIYIRKGKSEYSSVSFLIVESTLPLKNTVLPFAKKGSNTAQGRFWAKLVDVNTMSVDVVSP